MQLEESSDADESEDEGVCTAEEGRGETLESVAVVGCSEFLFQHGQALAQTLGNRLRVS